MQQRYCFFVWFYKLYVYIWRMDEIEFDKLNPHFTAQSVRELIDAHNDSDLISEEEFFNNLKLENE